MRYDGSATPQSRKIAYLMNPRADTYERIVRALRAAERRTRLYGGGPRFSRLAEATVPLIMFPVIRIVDVYPLRLLAHRRSLWSAVTRRCIIRGSSGATWLRLSTYASRRYRILTTKCSSPRSFADSIRTAMQSRSIRE